MYRQGITLKFYRQHNSKWFNNKPALALKDLQSADGNVISAGEIITIKRKWAGFIVMSNSGVCVWRVPPDTMELL